MVTRAQVQHSNAALTAQTAPRTAVFFGGTSGIGKLTLIELVSLGHPIRVYIAGRKATEPAIRPVLEDLRQKNPRAELVWVEAEVSLLAETRRVCEVVKEKETSLDFLCLTAGYAPFGGRNDTSEGIDVCHSLEYYCRMLATLHLLPLLRASAAASTSTSPGPTPRVLTVLAGSMLSTRIDATDLNLTRSSPSSRLFGFKTQTHMATMNTLFLDKLAADPANAGVGKTMPFPVLSKEPIPGLSLSAAGLVALADLQTIANRTALTGTSSWFDALVLAPGLHYQQAADSVAGSSGAVTAQTSAASGYGGAAAGGGGGGGIFGTQTLPGGRKKDVKVTNPGMLLFLSRLGVQEERAREKELKRRKLSGSGGVEAYGIGGGGGGGGGSGEKIITLDVGTLSAGRKRRGRAFAHDSEWEFERGSHLLYLASPVLTFAALTIMVLLADWWGLASILALITSRLLNIYIIKQRTPPPAPPPPPPHPPAPAPAPSAFFTSTRNSNGNGNGVIPPSEYLIPLTPTLKIRMRGPADDLAALTTDAWLLAKTAVQGYLEATAKLAVYVVAIFSGNVSQAGNIVMLVLLLGSAGLLGLSNGFMKGVRGKGRVARVWHGDYGDGPGGGGGGGD
ncbi:hypothetical protein CSAL01_11561, partial [Colletotrichum salicis]